MHTSLIWILTLAVTVCFSVSPQLVVASTTPTPPPAPTAPPAPTPPPAPTQEQLLQDYQAKLEQAKVAPTPRPTPTPKPASTPTPTETVTVSSSNPATPQTVSTDTASVSVTPTATSSQAVPGDSTVSTGNSLVTATIYSSPNTNQATSTQPGTATTGTNSGNGAYADNATNSDSNTIDLTSQNNQAIVGNDLDAGALSGDNANNFNVGSSTTSTGDANTIATLVTSANTNMAGVNAMEFNIVEDHVGDILLDFDSGCQTGGCQQGEVAFLNSGNGALSNNSNSAVDVTDTQTFQVNDADVENNIVLTANSGNNASNFNTGGDTHVETGDANIVANVANFLNNNISGNVIFATVNIMADLVGNIIMPAGYEAAPMSLVNEGNGAYSDNATDTTYISDSTIYQNNFANIDNDIEVISTTGNNQTNFNTHGVQAGTADSIETGNSTANVKVANIANQNIAGGDWWIVLVNEMGNWVGKIMGAPDGATMAGSSGTQFITNPDGSIDIVNTGNGVLSENSNNVYQENNSTTNQSNTANLKNNIVLDANTGGNEANYNTGGSSTINTGDTNVLLDLVNFVNNNISGGNVMVTVVNVFGSWVGDFVSPEASTGLPDAGIGGPGATPIPAGSTETPNVNPPDTNTNPNNSNESDDSNTQGVDSGVVVQNGSQNNESPVVALSVDTTNAVPASNAYVGVSPRTIMSPSRILGATTWYLTEKSDSGIAGALIQDSRQAHQPKQMTVTFAWPTVISSLIGLLYTGARARGLLIG